VGCNHFSHDKRSFRRLANLQSDTDGMAAVVKDELNSQKRRKYMLLVNTSNVFYVIKVF